MNLKEIFRTHLGWFIILVTTSAISLNENGTLNQDTTYCRRQCSQQSFNIETCSCKAGCRYFGDCCEDRHDFSMWPWPGTCQSIKINNVEQSIRIVTSCSKNSNSSFAGKCALKSQNDILSLIPVYDYVDDVSFKNIYCYLCYEVNMSRIIMWPFKIDKDCALQYFLNLRNGTSKLNYELTSDEANSLQQNLTVIQTIVQNFNCEIRMVFDNTSLCKRTVIVESCLGNKNVSMDVMQNMTNQCKMSAKSLIQVKSTYYRNQWCAFCNNITQWNLSMCTKESDNLGQFRLFPIALSQLLDFTANLKATFSIESAEWRSRKNQSESYGNITRTMYSNDTTSQQSYAMFGFYIGLSTLALSMVCTICFALVFASITTLRNKSSFSFLILAVLIFLSNICYILIILQDDLLYSLWTCRAIAMANYFFNMLSFLWSLVIAIDIFLMLYQSISDSGRASDGQLPSFHLICACATMSAIFLTALVIAVDLFLPNWSFAPQFGVQICWINSMHGHVLFYYVPLLVNISMNFIIFFCSVNLIHKASRRRDKLCNNKQEMMSHQIIIRVIFVTGLPNLLSFTTVMIPSDCSVKPIFEALYSCIYGLQGTFLCMVFFTSSQVQKKLKILLHKKPASQVTSASHRHTFTTSNT